MGWATGHGMPTVLPPPLSPPPPPLHARVRQCGENEDACAVDCVPPAGASQESSRPELNFDGMPNLMLVEPGGVLELANLLLSDIALVGSYAYTPSQPYINQGTGYGLFPSIALAPAGTVSPSQRLSAS